MKINKNKNIKIIIGIFIVAAVPLLGYLFFNYKNQEPRNLKDQLKLWRVTLTKAEKFKIENPKDINKDSYRITAKSGNDIIKIKRLTDFDNNDKKSFIKNELLSIDSLFEERVSPYPESITNEVICSDTYKPQKEEIHSTKYEATFYFIYAGERFNYGVCSEDLIVYESIYSLFDIKNKPEAYQLEIFTPKNNPESKKEELRDIIKSFNIK